MMHTRQIFISRRDRKLTDYLSGICSNSRAMRNTATFYIRNTRSGLSKSPEERTANETEVLHCVFVGIQKTNARKLDTFAKEFRKAVTSGLTGLKFHGAVHSSLKRSKPYAYPTAEKWFLSSNVLDSVFKEMDDPVYRSLPAQVNQKAIKQVVESWKSYFASLKAYRKDPSGFKARPREPGYIRRKEISACFTNQVAKLKDAGGKHILSFPKTEETAVIGRLDGKYVKAEVKPSFGGYALLVTAEDNVQPVPAPEGASRFFGLDIGIDNLAAVANNVGIAPFLIKGTAIKAMNQWYNKRRAYLTSILTRGKDPAHSVKESHALDALSRKRHDVIRDFFYKAAHYICRLAKKNGIQVIVAGHNVRQKDSVSMGRENNQSFVSIPHAQFLQTLKFTAWSYGIAYVEREESYTSKASLLDLDAIPTYGEEGSKKPSFSGQRIKRGLYRSGKGFLINSDINGSGNIIRKEYPDAFKGRKLAYLYTTTKAVGYKDLYKKGVPSCAAEKRKAAKKHAHKASPLSRENGRRRWDEKIRRMKESKAA